MFFGVYYCRSKGYAVSRRRCTHTRTHTHTVRVRVPTLCYTTSFPDLLALLQFFAIVTFNGKPSEQPRISRYSRAKHSDGKPVNACSLLLAMLPYRSNVSFSQVFLFEFVILDSKYGGLSCNATKIFATVTRRERFDCFFGNAMSVRLPVIYLCTGKVIVTKDLTVCQKYEIHV